MAPTTPTRRHRCTVGALIVAGAHRAGRGVRGGRDFGRPRSGPDLCPRALLRHLVGSLPKVDPGSAVATISAVRGGRHDCYDRLVVDVAGTVAGYDVRYVSEVRAEGSGFVVPVRGGAVLDVVVRATSYDPLTGRPTYVPTNARELTDVSGFRSLRQVAGGGSFEGQSTIAVGVRARLRFRVFVLDGPGRGSRLVIDVAHRW